MELDDHLQVVNSSHPQLGAQLSSIRTLEHVLNWMNQRGLSLASMDMVTQDEYSHDVIVPLPADKQWLVFAMT
jgi:hypothetical protein